MKFSTLREELLKPLQIVSGVVEKRQTLPILSNILVKLDENGIRVVATDLEMEIVARCNVDQAMPGSTTVPMRKLHDTCKTLAEGSLVNFELKNEKAVLKSGKTRFTLTTLPAEDFPVINTKKTLFEFDIDQSELKRLLDKSSFAMAVQDVRFYLNGLLLEIDGGKITAVATDGHRLALASADGAISGGADTIQAIVPRKAVAEISRLLSDEQGEAKIVLGENFLRIEFGDVTFTTKLIDGKYPAYQNVIPGEGDKIVVADKEELRQCLIRTSILSNEKYRGIRLELGDGKLKAVANNPEQEEAEDEIQIDYQGEGLVIGFNVSYLLEAITAVSGDRVRIGLTDTNGSALITALDDDSCRYVVMPMRL